MSERKVERTIESLLLASRWLLVPVYLLLSLILVVFGIKAAQEVVHLFTHVLEMSEVELTLAVLSLIDMTLVASLLVMVALSGYETFVSPFDTVGDMERPGWLGKLDPGTVKIKLAASIVAISAIHLLRSYLNAAQYDENRLLTLTLIHLAFVVSALLLAFTDKIAGGSHG